MVHQYDGIGVTPRGGNRRSILRRLEGGLFCSDWLIFRTTASKPPWRSTVSQSVSAMAWRRTSASALPAAGSRVVQAWTTRWLRSRCCWSHSPVRPSHIPGRLRSSVDEPRSLSIPPLRQMFPEERSPTSLSLHQGVCRRRQPAGPESVPDLQPADLPGLGRRGKFRVDRPEMRKLRRTACLRRRDPLLEYAGYYLSKKPGAETRGGTFPRSSSATISSVYFMYWTYIQTWKLQL